MPGLEPVLLPAPDPAAGGLGPVVASDLEGTLTAGSVWRGVARYLSWAGRSWAVRRFLVPRYAAIPLVRLGLVEVQGFRHRWMRDLARLLAGADAEELARMGEWVVEQELWPQRRREVLNELAVASAAGARVVLASGSYQPILVAFADRIGAHAQGSALEMREGRATGRLAGPIGTGARKAERLRAFAAGAPIVAAYGDSAADLAMLEAAERPVAVAPDAHLRATAARRGWRILEAAGPGP
jgi:phosphoserine phosphatase